MSGNYHVPKFSENETGYVVLLVIVIGVLFKLYTNYGVVENIAAVASRVNSDVVFNDMGVGGSISDTIFGLIGIGAFSFTAYKLWLWYKKARADADADHYAKSETGTAIGGTAIGGKCDGSGGSDEPPPNQVSLGDGNKVFHIPNQIFEYSDADKVCKSLTIDSKGTLATVEQLKDAWENDKANWCSYGWTKGGYALYPVQPEFFNRIQNQEKCKYNCGNSPGVTGGKILLDKNTENNKNKFGINCYGKLKNEEIDINKGKEYSIPCEDPKDLLKKDMTYDNLDIIVGSNIFNQKKHS